MSAELTPQDWKAAQKLLRLNLDAMHKLPVSALRESANLLRIIAEACTYRSRALHKFADGREAIGD